MFSLGIYFPFPGSGVVPRPATWNGRANVLYLDQPAGVGFSRGTQSDTSAGEAAKNVYLFVQQLFRHYPQYKNSPFYVVGESYGGHYVPAVALEIFTQNGNLQHGRPTGYYTSSAEVENDKSGRSHINLRGQMIGNGLTNAVEQWKWYPVQARDGGKRFGGSLQQGVITDTRTLAIMEQVGECWFLL